MARAVTAAATSTSRWRRSGSGAVGCLLTGGVDVAACFTRCGRSNGRSTARVWNIVDILGGCRDMRAYVRVRGGRA